MGREGPAQRAAEPVEVRAAWRDQGWQLVTSSPTATQLHKPQNPIRTLPRGAHAGSRTQSQACGGDACGSQEDGGLPAGRGPPHGQRRRHNAAQVSPDPALACPPLLQVFACFPHPPGAQGRESAHTRPSACPSTPCFSPHSSPPADHWALASGLPTYVAESGFVSPPEPCP